jgi:hypothetical protein
MLTYVSRTPSIMAPRHQYLRDMSTSVEGGRKVVILPPPLVAMARPFFKASMAHRGRILRFIGQRRGPVLRNSYGLY